jgi:sodium/hydrogen antiporter
MPTLAVDNFNIVCATLGGFIALFGLVSYLCKERFYLSETREFINPLLLQIIEIKLSNTDAVISLIAGAILSPKAANLIRPLQYAAGDVQTLNYITLYFARLTLGIQLVIAGVQLPSKYLKHEWKSLAILLGPGMVAMWLSSSLIIWALVPHLSFVHALAVAACITPTDPVLASNIVKGKFADKNIPKELQNIIVAESGANDGLGYPFLFLPLFLIQYVEGGEGQTGTAIGKWFYETWVYEIVLGTVYGAAVGWIAKELLHWAERKKYVDRESFIVFFIALAVSFGRLLAGLLD